ncbi:hypothetical protein ACQ4PT_009578 [Festuca glaucescens]
MSGLPGKAIPPATAFSSASSTSPAPPLPSTPFVLAPTPCKQLRLTPQAPWFLSKEQRSPLRSPAPDAAPDLVRVTTPAASTPSRSPAATASDGEEVPDSAPRAASSPRGPCPTPSPAGAGRSVVFNASAERPVFNAPAPALRSLVVVPPSYLRSARLQGKSPPPAAPTARGGKVWVTPPSRRRARWDGDSSRRDAGLSSPTPRGSQAEAALLRFKRRTQGRCARCLAPAHHHLVSACRDQIRCFSCNLSGHKERHCPLRRVAKAAPPPPPRQPPRPHQASSPCAPGARSWAAVVADPKPTAAQAVDLPLPPPPAMAMRGIGSAATRPDEDSVIIASSFEMDQDMKNWEETAAIAWVVQGNRKVEAISIDRAIRKFFRLSHRDLTVCPHLPVQFLIKFERKEHCSMVLKQGRVKADGAMVQIRPWRPLEHAFGAAMNFRVRLCLEGVPAYGHTPYVAERIIARRCSFDRLDDPSALLTSTRSLDCWAWTANPSAIPKVVWLTFTSRGAGGLASEVFVHEVRPTGYKRGATFRIIVHLDKMEDYSMAPLDFFGSSTDANAFRPTPVSFDWHYLSVDGMPPIQLQEPEDDEEAARAAALASRGKRVARNDHPRNYYSRRDDQDDGDRDGAHRQDRWSPGERHDADGSFRRERTRSPPRRGSGGHHGHRRDTSMADAPIVEALLPLLPPAQATAQAAAIDSAEFRAMPADQAASLRAELLACLADAVQPCIDEAVKLRSWNVRAAALLDRLCAHEGAAGTPKRLPPSPSRDTVDPRTTQDKDDDAGGALLDLAPQLDATAASDGGFGRRLDDATLDVAPLGDTTLLLTQLTISTDKEASHVSGQDLPVTDIAPSQAPFEDLTSVLSPATATSAPAATDGIDIAPSSLLDFINSVAALVQPPLVNTPPTRKKKKTMAQLPSPRRSGRIAIKKKARLLGDGAEAIQELIARVCGILGPTASFDDASRAAYKQIFMTAPLAASAIHALEALVKQVNKLKKKAPAKLKEAHVTISADV